MPAGDRDPRPAGHDPGADEEPLVDRVAEVDRQERPRADVADGGEAGLQRLPRVHDRREGRVEGRVLELVDLVVPIGPRPEVRVAVDQAGQDGRARQVDDLGPVGDRRPPRPARPALIRSPSITMTTVAAVAVARAVEEAAGLDDDGPGRRAVSQASAAEEQGGDEQEVQSGTARVLGVGWIPATFERTDPPSGMRTGAPPRASRRRPRLRVVK